MKDNKDCTMIGNEFHELNYVASKLGVKPSDVLKAKEETGSNKREVVEEFLIKMKQEKK